MTAVRVPGQQRDRRWIRLVLVVGIFVAAAYVVGVKPVFIWTEVACPPGHIERAVSLQDGIYWCVPPGGAAGVDLQTLPMASRQRWVGLYLANLQVRVFEFDNGLFRWLAGGVPAPG